MLAEGLQVAHVVEEFPELSLEDEEAARSRTIALGVYEGGKDTLGPSPASRENRALTAKAIGAIVDAACQRFGISLKNLLDIGAGPHGRMVAELLPEEARHSSLQMDINPEAVRMNRELHPALADNIHQGSYFRLQELFPGQTFSTVTGLSCLDCTYHVHKALESITGSLEAGGTFLHVQDVAPGDAVICAYVQRKLSRLMLVPLEGAILHNTPVLLRDPGTQISHYLTDYFREILQEALEATPQLEVLTNNYVVAEAEGFDPQKDNLYFHGFNLMNQHNREREPKYRAMALVTAARRKE